MRLIEISAWNDSGGGFLHRLFDGHPELDVWPFELLLGNDGIRLDRLTPDWFHGRFRWPRLHPRLIAGRAEEAFDAISDAELKAVLADPGSARHGRFPVDVSLDEWRRATADSWRSGPDRSQAAFLRAYLVEFLRLTGVEPGRKPILGHCPVAILDAEALFADFPDARLIHVLRDPLSGFADMRRRHPVLEARVYAEKWSLVNMAAALAVAKSPERVRITTLRSLLEDRRAAMQALCEFLGIGFDLALMQPNWRGVLLDEHDMGPFGGVPVVSLAREDALAQEIVAADRRAILTITAGASAVLARLGIG